MKLIGIIDGLAETETENVFARSLDRVAFVFLLVMVLFAPHSIAVTQSAWLIGTFAWVIRRFVKPRPKLRSGTVGIALIAFFAWSAISASFSYEPSISLDKLRSVSVLLIFFFVFNVVRNRRAVHFLAFALVSSCMVNVAWTPVQKLIGRGIEVYGVRPDGPLYLAGARDGDVIVRVNGKPANSPADIIDRSQDSENVKLEMNRLDAVFLIEPKIDAITADRNGSDEEKLGISSWERDHGFRAAGFYGHFTTYAEVLQLIGAIVVGFFIACFTAGANRKLLIVLGVFLFGIAAALLLTVTRASQLAFMISSFVIVLIGASRRAAVASVAVAIPAVLLGLYVLQQYRQVGFFDPKDGSIQYRQMMWRDGTRLWTENPRHMIVGVGMDSIKKHWEEWSLFDKGFQPMSHFHSTPVQLLVERGLPALVIWLTVLGVYARSLWRCMRSTAISDWRSRGILIGALGGAVGFFASGLVHYNLGDTEVAMVFYILMALSMSLVDHDSNDLLAVNAPILADTEAV